MVAMRNLNVSDGKNESGEVCTASVGRGWNRGWDVVGPCVVGQLYISPPKNKKYCTTMCWCVTRWLAWQKNVSEEETWAKTGRSYSQARIWPTCPKTLAPAILLVEMYFAEKLDTCSGFCT